jgi:hypothetical protein
MEYTPEVNFNSDKLAKSLLHIFKKGVGAYLKFVPPKKKLNWDKTLKGYEHHLAAKGMAQGLTSMSTMKMLGIETENGK